MKMSVISLRTAAPVYTYQDLGLNQEIMNRYI